MNFHSYKFFSVHAASFALVIVALLGCSDSSSQSSEPLLPVTNDEINAPADSSFAPDSLQTEQIIADSISQNIESDISQSDSEKCNPMPQIFPLDTFTDVGEVYKATQCNEKVIFMVRHGEREGFIGPESELTEDGVAMSIAMGQKLAGPEEFAYAHSGFVRTYQTVYNINVGRGQATFKDDTIPQLTDGWYVKNKELRDSVIKRDSISSVNMLYSLWAFDSLYADVFYDLTERSNELLNTYIVKDYAKLPKFTVVASHDLLLMPLTVFATNKQLQILKLQESRKWLTYLAGVAIIINDKNERRYVPIKGDTEGV